MSNNTPHPKTENNSQQSNTPENKPSLKNVRQDKRRFSSAAPVPIQPAAGTKFTRGALLSKAAMVCSQNETVQQNRTVKTTVWFEPIVRASLEQRTREECLSISAAVNAIVKKDLQHHIDLQYTALLEPIIEKCIDKRMHKFEKSHTHLLVRIAYDVGQIRALVANILRHLPGMTHDIFRGVVANSEITAKGNIARLTPQIKEMIAKVKERFLAQEGDKEPS